MTTLPDWLRPIFARVVASAVAALLAYLTRKGIDLGLSDLDVARFSEGISAVTWAVMLAAYAAVHRAISIKTNPTDSAAPSMAGAATGPLGAGERTTLGAAMDAAAKAPEPPAPAVDDTARRASWASRPPDIRTAPPTFEPLVYAPEPTGFGDTFAPPDPIPSVVPERRTRSRRKRAVVVQEPGAPQPTSEPTEQTLGYEP